MGDEIRLSIQQASHRLGVSVDTIRRRLKSKALKGQRDNAGQWWVMLPSDTPETPMQPMPSAKVGTPMQAGAVEPDVVVELRARIADLLAQAERDRAAVDAMRQERDDVAARFGAAVDAMRQERDAAKLEGDETRLKLAIMEDALRLSIEREGLARERAGRAEGELAGLRRRGWLARLLA